MYDEVNFLTLILKKKNNHHKKDVFEKHPKVKAIGNNLWLFDTYKTIFSSKLYH